jgi:hypothetical protein
VEFVPVVFVDYSAAKETEGRKSDGGVEVMPVVFVDSSRVVRWKVAVEK